nr:U32 family peptidase C-terminal domain-containing protein [Cellvibrionaceae bacterium]
DIRDACPEVELEVFVHGALCIAYSGRCLLSGYMTHRDPNQGACTNSCRWQYNVHEAQQTDTGDIIATNSTQTWQPEDKVVLLQEKHRPGEYMPAYEDEHGTYIMNSKDLRAVQHVERLVNMGIHSLKIEGRTKSHYYVARTAQVYRKAIDAALAGTAFDMNLLSELEHLANRGYTEGFYRRHVPSEYQNYEKGVSNNLSQQFVGEALGYEASSGQLIVEVKNKIERGDQLELITPAGNFPFLVNSLENLRGASIECAPGSGHQVKIPLPFDAALDESGGNAMLMRHLEHT